MGSSGGELNHFKLSPQDNGGGNLVGGQSRTKRRQSGASEPKPSIPWQSTDDPLSSSDLLELTKWHIDRYDRLRSSTSVRASVLLSANAILATGSLILVNYHLQTTEAPRTLWIECTFGALAVLTLSLILRSLWASINAIAARKTTRVLHSAEIPSRFLFNWGDTLRSIDGHSDFSRKVTGLDLDSILGHAVAELWTDILQHSQRHRHLRSAINTFRYCIMTLLGLATFTFAAALR
ncbi:MULTISPECIES: hypothetical protein [unclassified Streptomyces]|uniref:hypothetical protein n=1 Tax=unclassified Streptomyces TaxID=2593676 RepID=UPI001319EDAA|nr:MULTISPECIES: hypothetical protein [unclassified Streptomyces]MYT30658.1 hypothetical protein [Streptomyces sp. SID8354]